MSLAKDKPYYETPSDYEDDLYAWAYEQAQLLRLGRFGEVDLPNVIEELESIGRQSRLDLEIGYLHVIAGLLEWEYREQSRGHDLWKTIFDARLRIIDEEADSRTLRNDAARIIEDVYPKALRLAASATDRPVDEFPPRCPFGLDYLRDLDALPGQRRHEESASGVDG